MHQDDYAYLHVDVIDHVARIRIAGGVPGNVYRRAALADFRRLPHDLTADDDVHAAVLTAEGDAFTLGLHPDDYPRQVEGTGATRFDGAVQGIRSWIDLDKPVVVGLNGPVQGAPLTTVLLADVVVAEQQVRFRDFHVPAGLVAATGALLWPPSVGLLQAKRYVLGGEWISADEAVRLGLVSEVVPSGTAASRAIEHAVRLAGLPPHALRHTKRAMNQWLRDALPIFESGLAMELLGWQAEEDADRRRRDLTDEALRVAREATNG